MWIEAASLCTAQPVIIVSVNPVATEPGTSLDDSKITGGWTLRVRTW
jgi:hypothetical protein